ncbi:hypothetical protein [[Clostridium] aminophilum]|uniref:hypothetical protein n=1 Tax=[Clostridium] aminophilum TaxID=1526 RepID=UPI00332ECD76
MSKNQIFVRSINDRTLELLNEFRNVEKKMRNYSEEYRNEASQRINSEAGSQKDSAELNRQALYLLFLGKYSVLRKRLDSISKELGIDELYYAYKEIIENGADLSTFNMSVQTFIERAGCSVKGDREIAFSNFFGDEKRIFDGNKRFINLLKNACFVYRVSRSKFCENNGPIEAIGQLAFERIFVDFFVQYLLSGNGYIEDDDGMLTREEMPKREQI